MIGPIMDVGSVGLKANVQLSQVKNGGVGSGESVIWGKRLCSRVAKKSVKSRSLDGSGKSGVAFSVLTSDVNKKTLVSDHTPSIFFFSLASM